MKSKYLLLFSAFSFSLLLCVPLGITLIRIFTIQFENPFASPHLNAASVLWCLAYFGVLSRLVPHLHEKSPKWLYGVLLYGFLVSINYIWLNYFL